MSDLNWEIIKLNISEAREELEKIEEEIKSSDKPSEIDLSLSLRHAYHHLNFAWNIRNKSNEEYSNITDKDFKQWGLFPCGMDSLQTENL